MRYNKGIPHERNDFLTLFPVLRIGKHIKHCFLLIGLYNGHIQIQLEKLITDIVRTRCCQTVIVKGGVPHRYVPLFTVADEPLHLLL